MDLLPAVFTSGGGKAGKKVDAVASKALLSVAALAGAGGILGETVLMTCAAADLHADTMHGRARRGTRRIRRAGHQHRIDRHPRCHRHSTRMRALPCREVCPLFAFVWPAVLSLST